MFSFFPSSLSKDAIHIANNDQKSIELKKIPTYKAGIAIADRLYFSLIYTEERLQKHVMLQEKIKTLYQVGSSLMNGGCAYTEKGKKLLQKQNKKLLDDTCENTENPDYRALIIYHSLPHFNYLNGSHEENDIFASFFPIIVALDHMHPKSIVDMYNEIRKMDSVTCGRGFTLPNGSSGYSDLMLMKLLELYFIHRPESYPEMKPEKLFYEGCDFEGEKYDVYCSLIGFSIKEDVLKVASRLLDELLTYGKSTNFPHTMGLIGRLNSTLHNPKKPRPHQSTLLAEIGSSFGSSYNNKVVFPLSLSHLQPMKKLEQEKLETAECKDVFSLKHK